MTWFFPRLELAAPDPDFDEAVIIINRHEEETITVSCPNARDLAEQIVNLVNGQNANPSTELQAPYQPGPGYRALDC